MTDKISPFGPDMDDTIVAQATPPGTGALAIVRLSGPRSAELLGRVFLPHRRMKGAFGPWRLTHGRVLDRSCMPLDDVLAVFMPGPRTPTGEDMAEVQCHGSPVITREIVAALVELGARPAERGEFTRRAFLNGRMDLSQAEAVATLISAPGLGGARLALNGLDGLLARKTRELREEIEDLRALATLGVDFPEEETEQIAPLAARVRAAAEALERILAGVSRGRLLCEGATVVLAGAVNAGKSSLLNALSGRNRALVSDMPGTTRDYLEAAIDLDGMPVRLIDTAGLRDGADGVEELGIARSRELAAGADAALLLIDGEKPDISCLPELAGLCPGKAILVWNKCDLKKPCDHAGFADFPRLPGLEADLPGCVISCAGGDNLDALRAALSALLLDGWNVECEMAPNERQAEALGRGLSALRGLGEDIESDLPADLCLARLDEAAAALGEVLGLGTRADVLNEIFDRFCIGK